MKSLIKGLSTSRLLVTVSLTSVQAEEHTWCGIVNPAKTPLKIRAGMSQDTKVIATASKGSALAYISTEAQIFRYNKCICWSPTLQIWERTGVQLFRFGNVLESNSLDLGTYWSPTL
jgi:hypothetical protein